MKYDTTAKYYILITDYNKLVIESDPISMTKIEFETMQAYIFSASSGDVPTMIVTRNGADIYIPKKILKRSVMRIKRYGQ